MNNLLIILWVPLIILFLLVGIYFTFLLKFKNFKFTLDLFNSNEKIKKMTPFESLTTNLAASLGTGNIIGVSSAVMLGGPGSIFWMWVTAIIGSSIAYFEAFLGSKDGNVMKYISSLGGKFFKSLSLIYAVLCIFSSFTTGNMLQVNVITETFSTDFGMKSILSLVIAIMTFFVIIKGVKSIAKFTKAIVPFMLVLFTISCLIIILNNYAIILNCLDIIIKDAFSFRAINGSFSFACIRYGIARGIFTNEAGLGTASIVYEETSMNNINAGKMASLCVLIDTLFMCTLTALVIISSGSYLNSNGNSILDSFMIFGICGQFLYNISIFFFGFATIIGWYYLGEGCFKYVFGNKYLLVYKAFYCLIVFLGGIIKNIIIWELNDLFNGFMLMINLVILVLLSKRYKIKNEKSMI